MYKKNSRNEREITPFANEKAESEALSGFTNEIIERTRPHRDQMIDPNNNLMYRHGLTWSGPAIEHGDSEGVFTKHSTVVKTNFDDILKGDLALVNKTINEFSQAVNRDFSKMLFSTMQDATEKTGNIVRGSSKKSFPEIMTEMLGKIKFSVDKNGNISRPTMFISPEQGEKWEKEMADMDKTTKHILDEIIKEREQEAISDERTRLAKFERANNAGK